MEILENKIQENLVKAMKAKNETELSALRSIKAAIQNEKVNGAYHELTYNEIIAVIQKLSKQRQEAAEIYTSAGRTELAEKELAEKKVLDEYLPKMLQEDELKKVISETVAGLNVIDVKGMGLVIKTLKERYPNQFDGSIAARIVREILSK